MACHWRVRPHDALRLDRLAQQTGANQLLLQLLISRGVEAPDQIEEFLAPKLTGLRVPELLPGLPAAVDRITAAIAAGQPIVVFGDYDADGMTASAILVRCLRLLGGEVTYHVPNRLSDGYGLNIAALEQLAARGKQLVISVDCGIGSVEAAERCRQLGMGLVITDHHQPGPALPIADAIVHPGLPGGGYPFPGLCGAAVAYKLAWGLCQRASGATRVSPAMRQFLLEATSLAAIGTVADMVPLLDENRPLVWHGLKSLKQRPPLGLARLMKLLDWEGRDEISAEDIAFGLAPRLNAAGRLGQAQLGIELMTTDDTQRADALAEYLNKLNKDRETLERSTYLAASKLAASQADLENDPALVLASPGWHAGVIGIVASRLVERYQRPVVMIALDPVGIQPGQGSARTMGGVNLHAALAACSELLVSHGGHAAAAGLRIEERHLSSFRDAFCEEVARMSGPGERTKELTIDAETPLGLLDLSTVTQIERLAPFGMGNPRPLLASNGVSLAEPPKTMGGGDRHFAAQFQQHGVQLRGIAFGQGEWVEQMPPAGTPIDVVYRPVINQFRSMRRVELHIVDWRPAVALQPSP